MTIGFRQNTGKWEQHSLLNHMSWCNFILRTFLLVGFCGLEYEMQGNHTVILNFVFKMHLIQIMMNTKKVICKIK